MEGQDELDSLCWYSQHRSPMPHFWGCAPGAMTAHVRILPRFLYNAPTPKLHRPMFTCSEIIVLTNKHPTLFVALRRWANIAQS